MQIVSCTLFELFCLLEEAINDLAVEVSQVDDNSFPMHNINRLLLLILEIQVSDLQGIAFSDTDFP